MLYGPAETARITNAIDARLQSSAASSAKGVKYVPQHLHYPFNYMTQQADAVFNDPKKSLAAKMTRACERSNLLGVTNPDEQTFKWMLALLLLTHYDELPDAQQIYEKLQDLKACFEAERKDYPHQHMTDYPEKPCELPKEMFDFAYGDDGQPVSKELPGINMVAEKCVPLRSNSKLLQKKKKRSWFH